MKNKKIVIALFVLAVVLLCGFTANSLQGIFAEGDTYNVVIKYQTLAADGSPTLYKTFTEEYSEGEQINIKSPEIKGYKPNKTNVSAVVKSDLYLTVNYSCLHSGFDESLDEVVRYPIADNVGIIKHYCDTCDGYYQEEFTSITRTFMFGGEELKNMYFNDAGDVYNGYTYTGGELVLLKNYVPELDCIFNGIDRSQENWADGLTAKIEYDGWNETVAFCQDHPADISETFKVRFGDDWRVIMHYSPHVSGNLKKWLNSDSCPLRTSPLTITVTYDFIYTE